MHRNHKPKLVKTNNRYWNKNKTNISQHIGTEATKPTNHYFNATRRRSLAMPLEGCWASPIRQWYPQTGPHWRRSNGGWGSLLIKHLPVGRLSWSHYGIYFLRLVGIVYRIILLVETSWNVSCCRSHIMYIKGVWTVASSYSNKKHVQVIWHLSCDVLKWNGMIYGFLKLGLCITSHPCQSNHKATGWLEPSWNMPTSNYKLISNILPAPQVAKQVCRAWRPKTTKSSKELAPKRFAPCTEAQPAWTTIQAEV